MKHSLDSAMAALQRALETETAALIAGDLAGVATLGPAKAAAIEAFIAARDTSAPVIERRLALPLDRLRGAVRANREALQHAMSLQATVVEAIARVAVQPPSGATPGYARPAPRSGAAPLSFSMRA